MRSDLRGKRILVTGGTGFVGSRLVERLVVECGANVRVLVRNFANAVRIARFPIEMVDGDVLDERVVERACSGCDVVFHCVYGNTGDHKTQRAVTVNGTKNVLDAASSAKVERLVYLSTLDVYGIPPDGYLDEHAPRRYSGGYYADSKLDAEKIVCRYQQAGAPIVNLQPTIIYGPFGPLWTIDVLETLKRRGVILIDGGEGFCNLVYIDDVVDALLLAATNDKALGETFLISSSSPVTWKDFYGSYERMLGTSRTVSMSQEEALAYYARKQREERLLAQLARVLREEQQLRERLLQTPEMMVTLRAIRSLLPQKLWRTLKGRVKGEEVEVWTKLQNANTKNEERPLDPAPLHPRDVRLRGAKAVVRIDKAQQLLGYHPKFDLAAGMRLTEQWARWANLLN
jgi:nucleoside-diphosphate-sugar epimerase